MSIFAIFHETFATKIYENHPKLENSPAAKSSAQKTPSTAQATQTQRWTAQGSDLTAATGGPGENVVPKCAHPQKRVPNEVRSGRKLKMVGTPTCIAIKIWKITMFYRIEDTYLKQTHPYGRFKLDKLVLSCRQSRHQKRRCQQFQTLRCADFTYHQLPTKHGSMRGASRLMVENPFCFG